MSIRNISAILFILLISFTACKNEGGKTISYIDTFNLAIKNLSKKNGDISALITFENKFDSKNFKLKDANIDVYINGIDMGTFYTKEPFNIKSKSRLNLPFKYNLDNTKLMDGDDGYPESFKVQLKGVVSFVDDNASLIEIKINHKETVYPTIPKKEAKQLKKEEKKAEKKAKRELKKLRKLKTDD